MLKAFNNSHIALLRKLETDTANMQLWTNRREVYDEDRFVEDIRYRLRNYYHVIFAIEALKAKPCGFVYSYNFNVIDGFVYITTVLEEGTAGGVGVKATIAFLDYLFCFYPLRKVYFEVFAYNQLSQKLMCKAGCVLEGTLTKHRFFDGCYHDTYIYALARDSYLERFGRLIQTMKKRWL